MGGGGGGGGGGVWGGWGWGGAYKWEFTVLRCWGFEGGFEQNVRGAEV